MVPAAQHKRLRNQRETDLAARTTVAVALMALLASGAHAQSNLGASGYPDPQCGARPTPPQRPAEFENNDQISAFNADIAEYNNGIEAWVACIQTYVDNAAADIRIIKANAQAAVESANQ